VGSPDIFVGRPVVLSRNGLTLFGDPDPQVVTPLPLLDEAPLCVTGRRLRVVGAVADVLLLRYGIRYAVDPQGALVEGPLHDLRGGRARIQTSDPWAVRVRGGGVEWARR